MKYRVSYFKNNNLRFLTDVHVSCHLKTQIDFQYAVHPSLLLSVRKHSRSHKNQDRNIKFYLEG